MTRMITRSMARNFPKKRFHYEPYPITRHKNVDYQEANHQEVNHQKNESITLCENVLMFMLMFTFGNIIALCILLYSMESSIESL